ncbi:hypothetical protein [Burkholderia phage FLC9]|nr:hypothetical protein [Burkholderia phage FLC9]
MAGNRKAAEAVILEWIEKLIPDSGNRELYVNLFAGMDDAAFAVWMEKLERQEIRLAVVAPNLAKSSLDIDRNLKLADELGHNFFERILIDNGNDIPPYLSPIRYLVVDLPLRRQAQLLVKKISIPEDTKSVDDFTGQPTGKSKGSKISYPETQIMAALNLDANLTEMLKYRGGDEKGFDALNSSISKTGGVSLQSIEKLGTQVKSTQTLSIILTCMHLENTL